MKDLILTVTIFSSFVSPVFAEDLCREQAQQMGYVGAVEVWRPCNEPSGQVVSDAAQTTEPALAPPAAKRMANSRSDRATFGLEDVYTQ